MSDQEAALAFSRSVYMQGNSTWSLTRKMHFI